MLGLYVSRVLRVVAEHVTQLRYHPGEHARGDVAMPPHFIQQIVAGYQFTFVPEQDQQYRERLGLDGLRLPRA